MASTIRVSCGSLVRDAQLSMSLDGLSTPENVRQQGLARVSAVGGHSRIAVRTTSKPSAVEQRTVPTWGPPEAH